MNQVEKMKELFNDAAFVEKASKLQTAEEVSNLFAENDVDITPEELYKVKELLTKRVNGELTDEELEEVAGGVVLTAIVCLLVGGAACGGMVLAVSTLSSW